jgi:hypothetical protein
MKLFKEEKFFFSTSASPFSEWSTNLERLYNHLYQPPWVNWWDIRSCFMGDCSGGWMWKKTKRWDAERRCFVRSLTASELQKRT